MVFGELLVKAIGIELPVGSEDLPDEEYYEVIANLLAERGVINLIDRAPGDIVIWAELADVIYKITGGTEELSADEKMEYLTNKGYMPSLGPNSTIKYIEGEVLILEKDNAQWRHLNINDIVSNGDTVKTLKASLVKLQFSTGGKITLKEETALAINTADSNGHEAGGNTEISLLRGKLKAVIDRLEKDSTFEVKTPAAICGVRGTIFYVNVGAGDDTDAFVQKGKIDFLSLLIKELMYIVGEGEGSLADNKGSLTKPIKLPPLVVEGWIFGFGPKESSFPVILEELIDMLNNPQLANIIAEAFPGGASRNSNNLNEILESVATSI